MTVAKLAPAVNVFTQQSTLFDNPMPHDSPHPHSADMITQPCRDADGNSGDIATVPEAIPDPDGNGHVPVMEFSIFTGIYRPKAERIVLSREGVISFFSKRLVRSRKDGKLFAPATFNGSRKKSNFISASGICFDFDAGQPTTEQVLALFPDTLAVFYSTHSHCWKSKEKKVGGVTIPADTTYTPENPRFRVVIPLSRPVVAEEHSRLVSGVRSILTPDLLACLDETCFQMERSHYMPSCLPGHKEYAVHGHQSGELLDVEYFMQLGSAAVTAAKNISPPQPEQHPAPETAGSQIFEFTDPAGSEVYDLRAWAVNNPGFDIVAAVDPQFRRGNLKDGKQHICCPFEDQHTDQGEDMATYIANYLPPKYKAWDIHCCHAHCLGRDRLEYLLAMLQKGWISVDRLQTTIPVPSIHEKIRPRKIYYQVNEILAAPEWSALRPDERRIALDLMMMAWAEDDGMIGDDDWVIARRLAIDKKDWMSYRKTLCRIGWLVSSDGRLTNTIAKREFDSAQKALMSAIRSGSKGGKVSADRRK